MTETTNSARANTRTPERLGKGAVKENIKEACLCSYLNPVTEWASGFYVVNVGYECLECKKRTPASELRALEQPDQGLMNHP